MTRPWIPVSEPTLGGREREYVLDCLDSTWISSAGPYLERFEEMVAELSGTQHAVACVNGTAAVHLALLAVGVGPGDEVIVPTLTYVATVNAVVYCGATPVFVDAEEACWNLEPSALRACVTERTKAILVVHGFGQPTEMDSVLDVAREHRLKVIEDSAQAHGAEYRGQRIGSLGDVATFSFYANKVVVTGEGGAVTTADRALADRVRLLKGQGQDPERRYWFPVVGFNYRMTNIAAAIGVAQLERFAWHARRRREVAEWYRDALAGTHGLHLQEQRPWARSAHWMNGVVVAGLTAAARDAVMARMERDGVETRPFFYPVHTLPPYADPQSRFPVAERLAASGIVLPTSAALTEGEVNYVAESLVAALGSEQR